MKIGKINMKVGDIVFHKVFGIGKVLEVLPDSRKIKFESLKTCRNIRNDFNLL